MLYPLSYEGREGQGSAPALGGRTEVASVAGPMYVLSRGLCMMRV
jgi:hypothetical protein